MNISKNSVVSIHYTLKDDANEILDSSSGQEPLVYLHGTGGIIPGLEQALDGQTIGQKLNVTVAPEDGYGLRIDKMVQTILKSEFPPEAELEVGLHFEVETPNGPLVLNIVEVRDNEVVVDGNHPLAGKTLHFAVEVMDVRAATSDELEHGHAHGEGDHHHH